MNLPYVRITSWTIQTELRQLRDEGRDSSELTSDAYALIGEDFDDPHVEAEAELWLLRAHGQPVSDEAEWVEPDQWEEIYRHCRGVEQTQVTYGASELKSRLAGAWLGRAAGCLIGRPFEGLSRDEAWPLLKEAGHWPLLRLPALEDFSPERVDRLRRTKADALEAMVGRPRIMADDPTMDLPLLVLMTLERHGSSFSAQAAAHLWLEHVPLLRWSEAERIACRSLMNGFDPPESARHFNPCREWAGAMRRADHYGWCCPGDPAAAAHLAAKDASISHVKNGIYASMWMAAMNAAAFTAGSVEEILDAGLGVLPKESRLFAAFKRVMEWHACGMTHDEFLEKLHSEWNENLDHDWSHSISNSMVVLAALQWGEGDFRASVGLAAQTMFRTGANAASVGGILGAWRGEDALPNDYVLPLGGSLQTGILHHGCLEWQELIDRSFKLISAGPWQA